MKCRRCGKRAEVELRSHHTAFCRECFFVFFKRQVEKAIKEWRMFTPKDRILIAVSGGKDSLSLWDILLNLGYKATGLYVDLKIEGFSEEAKEKIEKFAKQRGVELIIVDLEKEGIPIPKVMKHTGKEPCSICGQVKRYYFNRIAYEQKFHVLVTGHNLDDETSRLLANLLRWQMPYLVDQAPVLPAANHFVKKVKPLYRLGEYEIAAYAFLRNIDYFAYRCPFSKGATFLKYKHYMAQLEYEFPGTKLDFYQGFLKKMRPFLTPLQKKENATLKFCPECGYPTLAPQCSVCRLKAEIKKAG
ncbi:MAG: adenine nucleotide alpha hydrolase family protein [Candidatus Desulfofervidaceae bacterium]|nr:adenine nucleotide alpha hydrolase family protein [Candidatus Desulfofervidaceae bacterium]